MVLSLATFLKSGKFKLGKKFELWIRDFFSYKIQSSNCLYFFTGVTSMVMLKPDELLVGSGDGNVCVVKDQTLKPSLFKKPSHDGIPKKITEPTKPCLVEV